MLAQAGSAEPQPLYPHLAAEINEMARVDQEVRTKLIEGSRGTNQFPKATLTAMQEIDHRDTARMKWVVKEFGWPTPAMVGREACGNAWLLVQHADDDKAFQKQCLVLIEPLARTGVIEGRYYAYLFDRVQVGAGKLQRFGTQGKSENDLMFIDPVEDPKHVDALRKRYGLEPLETYMQSLADAYHAKVAPDWRERLTAKPVPKK